MPKKEKVREMFDHIAPSYDRLNHILSLNVDKLWRRHALKEIVDGTPQRILDVACGTGDSTISIAKAAAEGSSVIGADISEGMMALVKGKAEKAGVGDRITLQVADGEDLPYGEGTFDRVTCAFGIRKRRSSWNCPSRRTGWSGGPTTCISCMSFPASAAPSPATGPPTSICRHRSITSLPPASSAG